MNEPMLEVQSLNAWYGAAHILFDLSFQVIDLCLHRLAQWVWSAFGASVPTSRRGC